MESQFDDRRRGFSVRQVGTVAASGDLGIKVRWSGYSDECEVIPFELAPDDLASFEVGDRFDAIVQRERVSWRLVEVLCVNLAPDLTEERRTELLDVFDRAPSAGALPDRQGETLT